MRHRCCRACRVRYAPGSTDVHATCPGCGGPLSSLAAVDALGHARHPTAQLGWGQANLDALAHAVADVIATTPHTR